MLDTGTWKGELNQFKLSSSEKISKNPKVSIIIANYSNVLYLKKMMGSPVQQTIGIEQLQVMFIDDCSTGHSLEVIEPYLERYPNIEICQLLENTGGTHSPRNVRIINARGECSVSLDADDWYDLNALKYLSDLLDDSHNDFAISGLIQSTDSHLMLKSKPCYVDGSFKSQSIQGLPAEFYGWSRPQTIILRTSLIHNSNLHFVSQQVTGDALFFYRAMRFSKTITQGERLTTYLNWDANNESLSKSINRIFMLSWLRALGYINQQFPDDLSGERMLTRRSEQPIYDFCIRRDTGYSFSKRRLQDFKVQVNRYLGGLNFGSSPYFRNDARQIIWTFLQINDIDGLYQFIRCQPTRWVLVNRFGYVSRTERSYYYPRLLKQFSAVRMNAYAEVTQCEGNTLSLGVYTRQKITRFEMKELKNPFETRQRLALKRINETSYQVELPEKFSNKENRLMIIFDDYLEIGVKDFSKFSA